MVVRCRGSEAIGGGADLESRRREVVGLAAQVLEIVLELGPRCGIRERPAGRSTVRISRPGNLRQTAFPARSQLRKSARWEVMKPSQGSVAPLQPNDWRATAAG